MAFVQAAKPVGTKARCRGASRFRTTTLIVAELACLGYIYSTIDKVELVFFVRYPYGYSSVTVLYTTVEAKDGVWEPPNTR